ncbi:RNA-guided endonuclease InsQ/TnpB family protein [Halogeometricum luteum]|uniref:Transposase n=1 Tax=Halogeometricum luteum TaxID=2950537 RepID=A0ABU2G4Z9_9EURY|nr:transposase [Halogeometricum sp. S3BR5-2]MDS0295299.1 transposase [Halogeometricum sp. S3BR5-2]
MRRANSLTAHATESWQKVCLCEWLAACCAFYNQVNYRRRQAYFETGNWKTATYSDLYDDYAAVTSKAACQQLVRKNAETWRGFDELDNNPAENPSPPGYWGNRREGYELKSVVRGDLYDVEWSADRSTIRIPVGKALNDKYDIPGRGYLVELELRGNPRWKGKQGRLDIAFDEESQCFRVNQPVTVQPDYIDVVRQAEFATTTLQQENTESTDSLSAAIDVGANNTLTIVTSDGDSLVFHARPEFHEFQHGYDEISELQSQLAEHVYSSERIRRRFDSLYGRRDHHRDTAVKHAARWLVSQGVETVYVGDVSDVLDTHWSAEVNQKTHNFWSHGQLTARLEETFEVAGLGLVEVGEYGTSSTCPYCSSSEVSRDGDEFSCSKCGVEAHSDIVGASLILAGNEDVDVAEWFEPSDERGSMARPVSREAGSPRDGDYEVTYLQWDDHEWTAVVTEAMRTLGSLDYQRGLDELSSSSGRRLAVSP